jgi:hypothetical protein
MSRGSENWVDWHFGRWSEEASASRLSRWRARAPRTLSPICGEYPARSSVGENRCGNIAFFSSLAKACQSTRQRQSPAACDQLHPAFAGIHIPHTSSPELRSQADFEYQLQCKARASPSKHRHRPGGGLSTTHIARVVIPLGAGRGERWYCTRDEIDSPALR